MNIRIQTSALALALAVMSWWAPAQATDCQLKLSAALDLGRTPDGFPTANVEIGGTSYPFMLATSSIMSLMNFTTYTNLKIGHVHASGVYDGSDELTNVAIVPELVLGGLEGKYQQFYVTEDDRFRPGVVGEIGLDKIERYDVELDLAHDKFKMFSQDHCKGQVIYWTDTAVSVPFVIQDRDRQFTVPMKLDDVPVNVLIDTAAPNSWMTAATAHRLFSSLPPAFKSLSIGGLAISNPDIAILQGGDERPCQGETHDDDTRHEYRCYGNGDLHLGLKQLRQLRLFIAFSEKTLYITAADAH